MKRILLVCSAGMSTSILVEKMRTAAEEQGIEVEVLAKANAGLTQEQGKWDCVLLGPQVGFALKQVQDDTKLPCEVIDMRAYGMGDGVTVLKQGLDLIDNG